MPVPDQVTDGQSAPLRAAMSELDALLPVVYDELHALAEAVLARSRPVDPTRTTSLIQDVYLRLAGRGINFADRTHFLCLAARAMRMVLIDRARQKGAAKRGGAAGPRTLDDAIIAAPDGPDLLAIDEALARLATIDERKSRIVELRFFGGLTVEETGEAMTLSPATVKREWTLARAWLFREMSDGTNGDA